MKTLGQRRALLLRFRRFHSALTDSQRKTNREFLIYGANTDVGKTVVSAAVCRYGLTTGHPVTYIKPVQTGDDTDAGAVVRHAVEDAQHADLITETLFHYPSPESPASAAIKAGVTPPDATTFRGAVRESLQRAKERNGLCIVETAGGPLSPGPNHTFQADLYAPLTLPCILVGDSKLGGISTTVCAYEALKARGQQPHFILFLDTSPFAASNATALHRAVGNEVEVLMVPKALPPMEEPLQHWLQAPEVAEAISKMLGNNDQKIGGDEDLEAHLKMDQQHLWHPYTSMTKPTRVWPVRSADGCSLHLEDGRQLVDGMASWWCAIHGYNVPELNAAATKQLSKMSHVMFGGLTHRPATELAKLLVENSPEGLTQVFLCDSGSVSVEVAIKMSLQYWAMQGKTSKTRIATVQRGYHGDTFGAMSVCDPVRGMHTLFKETLAQQLFAEPPALCTDWNETLEDDGFSSMETLLKTHHASTAAVILEPVVQGAGGMRIYHPNYLRKLRQLCDDLDVLLIFDEIATGFGRTGKLFAAQHAQVVPDIMCIGKALTGGYCTLGAALATERVGHGVSGDGTQPLMHGPTFMGNPLACSIASASIQLLLDSPWQKRVLNIQEQLRRELSPLVSYPEVKDVRALGAIGVVELHQPPKEPQKLQAAFVEEGVWLRPFGQTIYTMPPFVISPEELGKISGAIATVLDAGIQLVE